MSERGSFGLPSDPSDYTGKFQQESCVKFVEGGHTLYGKVYGVHPQEYRPYQVHVERNMQLLISGCYWCRENDLEAVAPEEMPEPLPADYWLFAKDEHGRTCFALLI